MSNEDRRLEQAKALLRRVITSEVGRKAMGQFFVDDVSAFLNGKGHYAPPANVAHADRECPHGLPTDTCPSCNTL